MKQKPLNSIRLRALMLVAVMCAAFAGQAWAAENDTHDFSQTLSQLLNNDASIDPINIAAQSYPVKKVIVSYRYNKTIEDAVTVEVTVNGTSWGTENIVGTDKSYETLEFTGEAAIGAIEISFTNNTGDGTGHGTFWVNNVQLVEGASAAPSYSITAVSSNNEHGTVSLTGSTITGSPKSGFRYATPAYTVTSGEATVAQGGNYFVVTPSSDCTVQINFEPIPTHTATFSVNGNTSRTATVAEGAAITFPEAVADPSASQIPETYNGKTFVGWYTEEYTNASVAPDYVNTATATMGVANVTYYAVYADVAEEESEDVKDAVKSQTLQYDSWTYSGSTADKSSYRLFGNGSYIQSAAFDLSKLIKVVVYGGTFGGESTYNSGTIGDGTNKWCDITLTGTGNAKEHTFTGGTALSGTKALRITSTAGNGSGSGLRISKVDIYVKGTVRTESNYTTDARSEAGISFAAADVSVKLTSGYGGQALTNPNSVTVAYSSSDETVATINSSTGVITELKKAGTTTITATFAGNATYKSAEVSYELTVTEKTPCGLAYAVAEVEKLTTDGTFTNALTNGNSLTVVYSSSDTDVATVNPSTGEVTIKVAGSTTITAAFGGDATYEEGEASYTLTVSKATPTLNFAKSSVNVELDEGTYKQVVTTEPADLPVTYTSSKGSVATVASDGTVTLLTTGSTTITANFAGNDLYNSANASYTLNVDVSTPLPFSFDGGKSDVASKTGLTQNGLGSDYGSSPKLKFDGTGDNLILKYTGSANVLTFDIVGNSFSGGTFKVQYSEDGVNYTDLETYDDLSAKQSESFDNIPASARYIKWIYTEKVSGNVGLGNISLNECEAITVGSAGYTTHVTSHRVSVPDGVTAYIATATGASTVTLSTIEKVPASTAIILKADEGSYKLPVTEESADDVTGNLLLASNGSVTGDGTTIYALGVGKSGVNKGVVGFYLVNDGQTIPAGKAYLNTGASVKEFLTFDFDDATAIAKIQDSGSKIQDSEIFNLAGQKMSKLQKGVNIVNGKKVLVK